MKPEQLYTLIRSHFVDGNLNLPASALVGEPAADSIGGHFSNASLLLSGASEPVQTATGVLIAKGKPGGLKTFPHATTAHAEWSVDAQGKVQMRLDLSPDEQPSQGWALAAMYSRLSPAFNSGYRFTGLSLQINSETPALDFAPLQQAFTPGLYHPLPSWENSAGLGIAGTFVWPERLEWLRPLFADDARPAPGTLQLVNGTPRYWFKVPGKTIRIGHLELETRLDVLGLLLDSTDDPQPGTIPDVDAFHRISAIFRLAQDQSASEEIPLEVAWQLSLGGAVEIVCPGISNIRGKIQTIAKTVCGIDLPDLDVEGLPWLDTFSLEEMRLGLDLERLALTSASASFTFLDAQRPFVIIPDLIRLTGIRVGVDVFFDAEELNYALDLSGQIAISDTASQGVFEVGISLPDCNFRIGLAEYSTLNAAGLLRRFVPGIPDGLNLELNELAIKGSRAARSFSFGGRLVSDAGIDLWLFRLEEFGFYFDYNGSGVDSTSVTMEAVLGIGEQFGVQVAGHYDSGTWSFEGSLETKVPLKLSTLLPEEVKLPEEFADLEFRSLSVGLSMGKETKISFELRGSFMLAFEGMAEVSVNSLSLTYESDAEGYKWEVVTEGGLKMVPREGTPAWIVDCSGKLRISGGKDSFAIGFETAGCTVSDIPLPIPAKVDNGNIEWSAMEFALRKVSLEKKSGKWEFSSVFRLKLTRAPRQLLAVLGSDGIGVKLELREGKATIKLEDPIFDFETPALTIPPVGELAAFPLGKARIQLSSLDLAIGKVFSIECGIRFWLPERTNHILGTDAETGKPKLEIFDTYKPGGQEEKALEIKFYGGLQGGSPKVGAYVSEVPLKLLTQLGDGKYALNLGPLENGMGKYGSVEFSMPRFEFNAQKGGLNLGGEFDIKKDFAIPLDLLKSMLAAGSMKEWADKLPGAIPIPYLSIPKLFENGKLNVPGFQQFFREMTGNDLPGEMVELLNKVGGVADKLPDKLKPYLDFPRPSGMKFNLAIKPDGGVEVELEARPCLRLLSINPPFSLQGITLRSFSFGTLLGGQLFSLRIDADFEQFDLAQLLISLLAPVDSYPLLGNPANYGTKLELKKLWILIFYQAGFPIPVPLFYDRVGIDYYGIGDFGFKAGVEFRMPSPDLREIGTLLNNLVRFISDKEFPLPVSPPPEGFDLSFVVAPTYLKLPGLIGGTKVGLEQGFKPPTLYQTFAIIANTLKFADLGYAIAIIPVEERFRTGTDRFKVRLLSMEIEAEWLVTTPKEFFEVTRGKLNLDQEQAKQLLAVIPGPNDVIVTPEDKGLISFFRGAWKASYGELEVVFGMAAMSVNRFRMGLRIRGRVAGLFDADISAFTAVNNQKPYFRLYGDGKTKLTLAGIELFTGECFLKVEDKDFQASGSFQVLNKDSVFYLKGAYSGKFNKEVLDLSGSLRAKFLVFELSGAGHIRSTGVGGTLRLGDFPPTSLAISESNGKAVVAGQLNLGWTVFGMTTVVSIPPRPDAGIEVTLNSDTFAGFLGMYLNLKASLGTINGGGRFVFRLLGAPVLDGWLRLDHLGLQAGGEFKFEIPHLFWLTAEISGKIEGGAFRLSGEGSVKLSVLPELRGRLTVTERGVGGQFGDLGLYFIDCEGFTIVTRGPRLNYWIRNGELKAGDPPCRIPSDDFEPVSEACPVPLVTGLYAAGLMKIAEQIPDPEKLSREMALVHEGEAGGYRLRISAMIKGEQRYAVEAEAMQGGNQAGMIRELSTFVSERFGRQVALDPADVTLGVYLDINDDQVEGEIRLLRPGAEQRIVLAEQFKGLVPSLADYLRFARRLAGSR